MRLPLFAIQGCLKLGSVDSFGLDHSLWQGLSSMCRVLSSIPGLYPLDAKGNACQAGYFQTLPLILWWGGGSKSCPIPPRH